jgi:uncharacterized protein (DUF305 family)
MQRKHIVSILIIVVILVIGIFIGNTFTNKMSVDHNTHQMSDGTVMKNEDHANHMMTVSSQKEFLEQMIPHHQEAIDTAKEVLVRGGTTPEIRILAENIIIAQEKEIAQMGQWYFDWYNEIYTGTNSYKPMMKDLTQLSGAELDKVFLEDMIVHHMGAIQMSQSVQPHIEKDEIQKLVTAIISTQTIEIEEMQMILKSF